MRRRRLSKARRKMKFSQNANKLSYDMLLPNIYVDSIVMDAPGLKI